MHCRLLILTLALSAILRFDAGAQTSAPVVSSPVVVVNQAGSPSVSAVSITGQNFGWPTLSTSNRIHVVSPGGTYDIRAADPGVVFWHPDRIVVRLSASIASGTVQVTSFDGQQLLTGTATAIDKVFSLDVFDLGAYPSTVAADSHGRVFVNEAFHRNLAVVDATGAVQNYPIPVPPDGGPFASNLNFFGTSPVDFRTPMSITGDGIVVDSGGNVWFTEGGQGAYGGIYPNRSRIVRFDPGKKKFRVYDVPADNSQVSAIAVVSGRVWFATGAHDVENYVVGGQPVVVRAHVPAKIVSFDPGRIPFGDGTTIDYSRVSLSRVCAVGSNETSCYHEYPIPDSCTLGTDGFADCTHGGWIATRPLSLLVAAADGKVWYGDYGGPLARQPFLGTGLSFVFASPGNNVVGRVTPTSTVSGSPMIDLFPLAKPLAGGRPTTIAEATSGDIAISENLDNTFSLLSKTSVVGSPATCMQLQANHKNSCMSEIFVPDFSYKDVDGTKHVAVNGSSVDPGQGEGVYGIGFDGDRNLWFTQTGPDQPNRLPSLGYVTPDWAKVVRLPPMGIFPARTGYSGLGMTVDQSGNVWFADFLRQRVSRLRRTL